MENIENKIPNGENQDTQNSSFFSENVSSSNGLEPKLRFPNFIEKWTRFEAENIFKNITDKNHPTDTVLTIQQGRGTLPRDLSGRNILYDNTNTKNYKRVQFGDFIIHLRSFEGGLEMANEQGIVSPAYTILRYIKPIAFGFYKAYFRTNEFINHILSKSVEGIRDGKQISYDAFKWLAIPYCQLEEQQKIADFLSLVDQRIEKQRQLVESLKKYKRGLLSAIFDNKLIGENWKKYKLSSILKERSTYSEKDGSYEHVTLSRDGIIPKTERYDRDFLVSSENKKYKITKMGDICYNPANMKFGVICLNTYGNAIFSPIYITFEIKSDFDKPFVGLYMTRNDFINRSLKFQQGTVYERMAVSPEDLLSMDIELPNLEAQKRISNIFTILDKKIVRENNIFNELQKMKRALLQQMFI